MSPAPGTLFVPGMSERQSPALTPSGDQEGVQFPPRIGTR